MNASTPTYRPGHATEAGQRFVRRVLRPWVTTCFRPSIEGLEHLPLGRGPYMIVANHSAGLGLAEIASFAVLYLENVGAEHPIAGYAHPIGFKIPGLRNAWRDLGTIPSTYEDAEEAIEMGVPLLVFPGGDHETLRPIWQANRVDFGGRRGFLRIARKAGVPIVPMGIRGSHYTVPMLWRSKLLAWLLVLPRILGVKRWGVSLFGLVVAVLLAFLPVSWPVRAGLIFVWLSSPWIFLPVVPATIRMRLGPALGPDELFGSGVDEDLGPAYDRVIAAVQREVDRAGPTSADEG